MDCQEVYSNAFFSKKRPASDAPTEAKAECSRGGIQMNNMLVDCQLSGNRIAEDTLHAVAYVLRRNRTNMTAQAEQLHAANVGISGASGVRADALRSSELQGWVQIPLRRPFDPQFHCIADVAIQPLLELNEVMHR